MKESQKIYLIGICGTAMASLAGMLREKGYSVCGSDSDVYPPMSDFLDRLGIPVFKGYSAENVPKAQPDLVVIGNAQKDEAPTPQAYRGVVRRCHRSRFSRRRRRPS